MTTPQLFAQECKQSQRRYLAKAKRESDRSYRKYLIERALVNRKHAREWAAMS
ncbi:hypothetical protein [Providencia stuartii]|uniref:hypothetical protein n=1 Tax=Providencia stuartii TaxID=588 RepID=UPI0015DAEB28|nr:hypothetical protein [Providencia stuartii]